MSNTPPKEKKELCGLKHEHNYYNCCAACIHREHPSERASGHMKNCKYYKPKEKKVQREKWEEEVKLKFFKVWDNIRSRCKERKNYVDRGIKNMWTTYKDFYNDMYKSYLIHIKKHGRKNTTIERLDNNGNYCKENCCWATYKRQMLNKRNTRYAIIGGEKIPFKTLCKNAGIYEIEIEKLAHRIKRGGYFIEYIVAKELARQKKEAYEEVIKTLKKEIPLKMDDRPEITEWLISKEYTKGFNAAVDELIQWFEIKNSLK